MQIEPKPCANGCGRTDIKNQKVHDRFCPKLKQQDDIQTYVKSDEVPQNLQNALNTKEGVTKVKIRKDAIYPLKSSSADKHSIPQNTQIPKAKVLKESVDKSTFSTHGTSDVGSTWWQRNVSQREKYNKKKIPIIIGNPDPKFTDDGLSESERLKKFLADAPAWTRYRPSDINRFITEKLNPGKTFAPCVFVGENRAPRVLYLPYEPEKNRLIIPNKGYYMTPTTGTPFFFHEDFMLPLVNSPNLKDRFQLPGHVVESAHGAGLREGTLQNADKFLNEIKKYKMVCYLLAGISILLLIALIFTAYTYDSNYKHLASAYTNMSEVIYNTRT